MAQKSKDSGKKDTGKHPTKERKPGTEKPEAKSRLSAFIESVKKENTYTQTPLGDLRKNLIINSVTSLVSGAVYFGFVYETFSYLSNSGQLVELSSYMLNLTRNLTALPQMQTIAEKIMRPPVLYTILGADIMGGITIYFAYKARKIREEIGKRTN
jgi:hypothetical protein